MRVQIVWVCAVHFLNSWGGKRKRMTLLPCGAIVTRAWKWAFSHFQIFWILWDLWSRPKPLDVFTRSRTARKLNFSIDSSHILRYWQNNQTLNHWFISFWTYVGPLSWSNPLILFKKSKMDIHGTKFCGSTHHASREIWENYEPLTHYAKLYSGFQRP